MTPFQWHQNRVKVGMTPATEVFLDLISNHKGYTVMDLLHMGKAAKIGAIATLHTCLKWLLIHGYVEATSHATDQRLKLVHILPKGRVHLGMRK